MTSSEIDRLDDLLRHLENIFTELQTMSASRGFEYFIKRCFPFPPFLKFGSMFQVAAERMSQARITLLREKPDA